MKKMNPTGLFSNLLRKMTVALAIFCMPLLALAEDAASDVVQPPKEFNLMDTNWMYVASVLLLIVLILIFARAFNIGSLTEVLTGKRVINWNNVNKFMALLIIVFGAIGVAYEMVNHGKFVLNGNSASEHGKALDSMFNWTFGFTFVVFIITEVLLFWFMFRYSYREGKKALYFFHNNQLEMLWTIVPAVVLTFLVLRGFRTWSRITDVSHLPKNTQTIEVFAYQFGWKARYAGEDNKLGDNHFTFISGDNSLGLAVESHVDKLVNDLNGEVKSLQKLLLTVNDSTIQWVTELRDYEGKGKPNIAAYPAKYKEAKKKAGDALSGKYKSELEKSIKRKQTTLKRIAAYRANKDVFNGAGNDDKITTEIVLVKGKTYLFKFRAKDVIHSAWMPDFRSQINVVPGMGTHFSFTPVISTAEARKLKNNKEFDYFLYCNKICGGGHSGMKLLVTVVETEAEYNDWIAKQPQVIEPVKPEPAAKPAADSAKSATPIIASK